jgi:nitrate reductase NapAB chaperone NapD
LIISGIVVASRPEHQAQVRADVTALPWAQAHYSDPAGRLVVTIEADDVDESMARLKAIQALPRVVMAELAEYAIENDEGR